MISCTQDSFVFRVLVHTALEVLHSMRYINLRLTCLLTSEARCAYQSSTLCRHDIMIAVITAAWKEVVIKCELCNAAFS